MNKTSPASNPLPIIRIVSTEDEMHTKMNLEMEDETHDMLVKWGKEVASDEDYVSIAIRAGLEEYIDSLEES
jgi:bacterioferritin (cytochrome b1)